MEPQRLTNPLTELLTHQPTGLSPATISDAAGDATVVGLGVNTRETREIFELVAETTYALIEKGFTSLAIQDTQRVTDLLDAYIDGADIDIDAALAQAWGPWQTVEMHRVMQRLREHNRERAGSHERVRIIGLVDSRAVLADYDRVVELLTEVDAQAAAGVEENFATIRIAHSGGEHVERAHGTHAGTAYVDLARVARDITAGLPESPQRQEALQLLEVIVDYHADALGKGFDRAREEGRATKRILEHYRRTGARIVIWDGFAHIAAHPSEMYGHKLRQELGQKYWAAGQPNRGCPSGR